MRVLIIGGGLGGLTLAHGLRNSGIGVAVHERSSRTGPQPAGYGIHINDHGNRALHACLPEENWRAYDQRAFRPRMSSASATPTSTPSPNFSYRLQPRTPTRSPTAGRCAAKICTRPCSSASTTS